MGKDRLARGDGLLYGLGAGGDVRWARLLAQAWPTPRLDFLQTMIVYRDLEERVDVAAWFARQREVIRRQQALPHPDHETVVRLLVEFGEIEAALCDRLMTQGDADSGETRALRTVALGIGHLLRSAWLRTSPAVDLSTRLDMARRATPLPSAPLSVRIAEGFAIYGLYPETYLEAAERFARSRPPTTALCIGLRTIGAPLSAVVAAALEANGWRVASVTLRPRGDPFDRQPVLAPSMVQELQRHRDGYALVVDEGPGLSGTSLAGTAELLHELGFPDARIVLFPSWVPETSALCSTRAQARWSRHEKFVGDFEQIWIASRRLTDVALKTVDGGRWREGVFTEDELPPVQPQHERRKYLTVEPAPRLFKFAGLGSRGDAAFRRARILMDAGFTPPVEALRHGFLIQRWLPGRPLTANDCNVDLIDHAARYLAFLQHTFPSGHGTPGETLRTMAFTNLRDEVEPEYLEHFPSAAPFDAGDPVAVDGRMQPWEWLATANGPVKTDAIDHHGDHFFPGCTDIAWDLAGFAVEFALDEDGVARLLARFIRHGGERASAARLPIFRVAYLAFRLGYARLAAQTTAKSPESARFVRLADGYRRQLIPALEALRPTRRGRAL